MTGRNGWTVRERILAGLCLGLILAIQAMRLPNPITGVAVNALFVVAVRLIGCQGALLVGFLSPICASLTGHLDLPLQPLLPLIIVGNLLFIGLYGRLTGTIRFLLPPLGKALTIGVGGVILARLIGLAPQFQPLLAMLLGIQFFTALGGILVGEQVARQLPASARGVPVTVDPSEKTASSEKAAS